VDRSRTGTKHHQAVKKNGLPLATVLPGANVSDGQKLLAVVDAIPFVRGKRGGPRHRPEKVDADKAYDDKNCAVASESVALSLGSPGAGLRARRS